MGLSEEVAHAQKWCDWFNAHYEVGAELNVLRNNGEVFRTRVEMAARPVHQRWGIDACAWFEGLGMYTIVDPEEGEIKGRDRVFV